MSEYDLDELVRDMYPDDKVWRLEPKEVCDPAIVGIAERNAGPDGIKPFLVYDQDKLLDLLAEHLEDTVPAEDARQEASEWFDYNILPSATGDGAPAFIRLLDCG